VQDIPTYDKMLRPILTFAAQGPLSRRTAAEAMTAHFHLSQDQAAVLIPSGASSPEQAQRGNGPVLLRDAGGGDPEVPEPRHSHCRGDRGVIRLAKEMRDATARGEQLGLNDDEVAFCDALGTSDSAVQAMGNEALKTIARELTDTLRRNVSIDWTLRESVRAQLRVLVKRILKKYGYPPEKQESAVKTVLEQAETLSAEWATA
jgi:restriction endonuclease Mrr